MRESCEMFNHDDFASRLFGFPQQYRSQHLGSNMLTKGLLGFYFWRPQPQPLPQLQVKVLEFYADS